MPIFKGDNWQHLYKGDGHPAALYKGSKKLAGWTEKSQAGVSHAYFDDTYNDKADVVIHGKSSQVVTTGAQLVDWKIDPIDRGSFTKTDENYTLKQEGLTGNTTRSSIKLQKYDGETYTTISTIFSLGDKKTIVFTKDSTFKKIRFGFNGDKEDTMIEADASNLIDGEKYTTSFNFISNEVNAGEIDKIILSKGDAWHDFEPYTGGAPSPSPDYPQEITSVGDSGSVEVVTTGAQLVDWEFKSGDFGSFIKTDENYTLEQGGLAANTTRSDVKLQKYDGETYTDISIISSLGDKKTIVFTKDSTFKKIRFGFNGNKIDTLIEADVSSLIDGEKYTTSFNFISNEVNAGKIDKIILSKGDTWHDFEPYRSSTATFSTPNGLPGIPVDSGGNYTDADGQQWICDEIDTKAGVYRQRVGKVQYVGDTSESWIDYTNETYKGFTINAPDRKIAAFNPGICNRFRVDMTTSNTDPGIWLGSTSSTDISTAIYFHNCNPSIASSVGEWRTWLSTHPVTLIYPLATPVETPLSDAVDTFLGGTNLFISEHEMDVTVKTEDQANPTGA